jgi:1,4-dihydroxy-2-naphthoyl-CoA hydrolase
MPIWFDKSITLEKIKGFGIDSMAGLLGIKYVEIGENFLKMSMPVDNRTRQPYGLLHGGASCALAETVGSISSALVINPANFYCVGMEINANHIKGVEEGIVIATCIPLHLGKNSHVWDIKIEDEAGKLICVSRLTVAIIIKRP